MSEQYLPLGENMDWEETQVNFLNARNVLCIDPCGDYIM